MSEMNRLLKLMSDLRDPIDGCPWDVAQTFETIAPYTIEEAYEVVDAIDRNDLDDLRDELGDLLLQVVFQSRLAEEAQAFAFSDVVQSITRKLIRRHPHILDAQGELLRSPKDGTSAEDVKVNWERQKAEERRLRSIGGESASGEPDLLGSVTKALPALLRAAKVSRQAASHGFDWPDVRSVIGKVREELDEVAEAIEAGDMAAVSEEIGDLLFSVANLARHADVDPETALRAGTLKFEARFAAMAQHLADTGRGLAESDLAAMEDAWQAVKQAERARE